MSDLYPESDCDVAGEISPEVGARLAQNERCRKYWEDHRAELDAIRKHFTAATKDTVWRYPTYGRPSLRAKVDRLWAALTAKAISAGLDLLTLPGRVIARRGRTR